jgi:hypothetical protein
MKYRFELGEELIRTRVTTNDIDKFKVIKVTKCGYNILDVQSNKCILKSHLYPIKKSLANGIMEAWVPHWVYYKILVQLDKGYK